MQDLLVLKALLSSGAASGSLSFGFPQLPSRQALAGFLLCIHHRVTESIKIVSYALSHEIAMISMKTSARIVKDSATV